MNKLREFIIEISLVLLLMSLFTWIFFSGLKEIRRKAPNVTVNITIEECNQSMVDTIIDYIKQHEGFSPIPYKCLGGVRTIGFGHVIQKTDTFTLPIDEHTAERILVDDFYNSMRYAAVHTNLKGNKLLAISHFIYGVGVTNFLKSNLPTLIRQGKPIDEEIIKYSKINGKPNSYLLKIRLWELKLYNK